MGEWSRHWLLWKATWRAIGNIHFYARSYDVPLRTLEIIYMMGQNVAFLEVDKWPDVIVNKEGIDDDGP